MKIVKLNPTVCPNCKGEIDIGVSCSPNTGAKPGPGQMAVCMGCGAMLVFNTDLTMRHMTMMEMLCIKPSILMQMMECSMRAQEAYEESKKNAITIKPDDIQEITE